MHAMRRFRTRLGSAIENAAMTNPALESLLRASLDDILVGGFVDTSEEPVRFWPLFRYIFIRSETNLVGLTSVQGAARARIELLNSMSFAATLDDDMRPAFSSLGELILRDADGSNLITGIQVWDGSEADCSAVRLDLENGQSIFFDPSYHFGFRVGGAEQEAIWRANWPGNHSKTVIGPT